MIPLIRELIWLITSLQIKTKIDSIEGKVDGVIIWGGIKVFLYKVAQLWHLSFWGLALTFLASAIYIWLAPT